MAQTRPHDSPALCIAFRPDLARALESRTAALLLDRFIYRAGIDGGGWFTVTADMLEHETTLSRKEQVTARGVLRQHGLIDEELRGLPALLWYRIRHENIELMLARIAE